MQNTFEKYQQVIRILREAKTPFLKKYISAGNIHVAQVTLDYNARNREQVLNHVLKSYNEINTIGIVNSIIIRDTANYVERDEKLMRSSEVITHCANFDEVEDLTPVTNGKLHVEVVF